MTNVRSQIFKCDAADEHLLRRLGSAVVIQWSSLNPASQDLLLEQATHTLDPNNESTSLKEQLKIFIRRHQSSN